MRALGTMAVSVAQAAATRVDGMVSLARCRAVDGAGGQLIVRESGGYVEFVGYEDPLGAPLDLEPHAPIVAARTPRGLEGLAWIHRACRGPHRAHRAVRLGRPGPGGRPAGGPRRPVRRGGHARDR